MFHDFELNQLVKKKQKMLPYDKNCGSYIVAFMGNKEMQVKEISEGTGIAPTTVRNWLVRNGVKATKVKNLIFWRIEK